MFERFTDRARRVVVLAQEEARMLDHNYIGTEHILLGLIREGEVSRPGRWRRWASAWTRPRQRSRTSSAAAAGARPGTSRSRRAPRRCSSSRCVRRCNSATATSAPSTSCSASSARATASPRRSWCLPAWTSTGPGSRSSSCCTAEGNRAPRLPLPRRRFPFQRRRPFPLPRRRPVMTWSGQAGVVRRPAEHDRATAQGIWRALAGAGRRRAGGCRRAARGCRPRRSQLPSAPRRG